MNYIKFFDLPESQMEAVVNAWLLEIHEKRQRVLNSKLHYYTKSGVSMVKMVFTINELPHPHSKE